MCSNINLKKICRKIDLKFRKIIAAPTYGRSCSITTKLHANLRGHWYPCRCKRLKMILRSCLDCRNVSYAYLEFINCIMNRLINHFVFPMCTSERNIRSHDFASCCSMLSWLESMYGPFARYVKLLVAHAPGMPGTFPPQPRVSDPDMHHGTCVTHVPWYIPISLTSGFLWSRLQGKRSRHSRRMRSPQDYLSDKWPMVKIKLQRLCERKSTSDYHRVSKGCRSVIWWDLNHTVITVTISIPSY